MMCEATVERIIAREKASRLEAENLLEEKSLELYRKNQELEKSTASLKQTHSVLTEVLASVPNPIIMCTEKFIIRMANKEAKKLFDLEGNGLEGKSLLEYFPDLQFALNDRSNGEIYIDQFLARTSINNELPMAIHGRKGPVGKKSSYLFVMHDISRRLEIEQQREQMQRQVDESQRLEAIGALSSGIAHEINTPIQFISDNLEFLRHSLNESPLPKTENAIFVEISEALQDSVEGVKQVRDIINLMRDVAHPGIGQKDSVDMNDLIENVIKITNSKHKNTANIELNLSENFPFIECHRAQIQQVILNIILNAVYAVEGVGQIPGNIRISTEHKNNIVRLLFSDTGCGVPIELREKIFLPFFTTKPVGKGTGQGLALAKDCIVKGHGGKLSLIDVDGYSTTFMIELPIVNTHISESEQEVRHVS